MKNIFFKRAYTAVVLFLLAITMLFGCKDTAGSDSGNPDPPEKYTVIYSDNESSGGTIPTDNYEYTAGSSVVIKNNYGSLYKEGPSEYLVFAGWNTEPDGEGTRYVPGQTILMSEGGLVLYARWIENGDAGWFKLDYNMGDYDSGEYESGGRTIAYMSGETVYAAGLHTLVRSYYNFTGYNTAEDGSGTTYQPGDGFTIDQNIQLYAQWEIDPDAVYVTVTYSGNGNTCDKEPKSYMYFADEEYTMENNFYSKIQDGILCIFTGWNTEYDGSGDFYDQGDPFIYEGSATSTMELHAQWSVLGAEGPGGGLVFYDKGNIDEGWRYLEASPRIFSNPWYDSLSFVWSNRLNKEILSTGNAIGDGYNNTQIMLAWFAENTETSTSNANAAEAADAYENNGVSDWFLPSIDELQEMYTVLHLNDRGMFQTSTGYYWSSTCSDTNDNFALFFDFGGGSSGSTSKGSNYRYRPIRKF
jgi:hypothetical protein